MVYMLAECLIVLILIGIIVYFEYHNILKRSLPKGTGHKHDEVKILVVDGIDYAHYKPQYDEFLKQFEIVKVEVQRDFDRAHYHVKVTSSWNDQLSGNTVHKVLPTNLILMATAFDVIAVD